MTRKRRTEEFRVDSLTDYCPEGEVLVTEYGEVTYLRWCELEIERLAKRGRCFYIHRVEATDRDGDVVALVPSTP